MMVFCAYCRIGHFRPCPSNMNELLTNYGGMGVVFTEMFTFCPQTRGPWKKIFTKSIFEKSSSPKFDFLPKFVYNKFRNKTKATR